MKRIGKVFGKLLEKFFKIPIFFSQLFIHAIYAICFNY